jgi:CDP-6-deoxy-D-xylo-4-hexulose-3-dehydrase
MQKYSWLLNINNFSYLDRVKIALFILNFKNRWTQDNQVKKFEKSMANFIGCKYAIFVSSGSTANTLLAQYVKDSSKNFQEKNIIVLPSTTWQTSCSPWIREGFRPHFIDISLENFAINKVKLLEYVKNNYKKIACIFPTSLIGFSQDINFYRMIEKKYKVKVMLDNCENTLGDFNGKNLSSHFTSSTSTYFGHQIQSIEGGFIFTNSEKEYEYFLMNRNHGMTRSLKAYGINNKKYQNKNVDGLFDFYSLGNNFRNTDLNAFIGLLDLNRINFYKEKRNELYGIYYNNLDQSKFYLPSSRELEHDVPFCLPIIIKNSNKELFDKALNYCKSNNIEYRPIISGFLGYQTCYKEYFNKINDHPNSIYLHKYGFYVGLYTSLKKEQILKLTRALNNL